MSLRMGSNGGGSRASALDKRVPRNPRYANVKSKASQRSNATLCAGTQQVVAVGSGS